MMVWISLILLICAGFSAYAGASQLEQAKQHTLLEQPTFTYRMVISSTKNHALAGILTKAMYAMPQNLVEDLAAQYTTYKATELTFVDWIRLHVL